MIAHINDNRTVSDDGSPRSVGAFGGSLGAHVLRGVLQVQPAPPMSGFLPRIPDASVFRSTRQPWTSETATLHCTDLMSTA